MWQTYAHDYDEYYEGAQYTPFDGQPSKTIDGQLQKIIKNHPPKDILKISVGYLDGEPQEGVVKTTKTEYTIAPIFQR